MIHFELDKLPMVILDQLQAAIGKEIEDLQEELRLVTAEKLRRNAPNQMTFDVD